MQNKTWANEYSDALVSAYNDVRLMEREFGMLLPRQSAVEARALYAWSKIDTTDWDMIARALTLIPTMRARLMNSIDVSKVAGYSIIEARELRHKIDMAIITACEKLTSIVDEHADSLVVANVDDHP